ncbi:MAG: type II toxin-antitoxin system RelE/ParE family toxin [Planctomycetes bacterium]|nr:type II toxin-antitoxin system RelE/ParE family toxin [Planctomycetota bacterium]
MNRYVTAPEAREDLKSISQYLAKERRSPAGANRLRQRLLDSFRQLASQPGMGEARPDLGVGIRQWPVGSYVVYYKPTTEGVLIIRIIHGARTLPDVFRE